MIKKHSDSSSTELMEIMISAVVSSVWSTKEVVFKVVHDWFHKTWIASVYQSIK